MNDKEFEKFRTSLRTVNSLYERRNRINLKLITTQDAIGRVYLGSVFDKRMWGLCTEEPLPFIFGYGDSLFLSLVNRIREMRKEGMEPKALSVDCLCTHAYEISHAEYESSECRNVRGNKIGRTEYTFMINFYGKNT
ncbi:MAG: hypothetical protein V1837_07935 [Candidatus Woesearchaeota archaeon]